jgi:TRAP-type mannitol/chloroaromatic compound transport system permease small subunit
MGDGDKFLRLAKRIDKLSDWCGRAFAWLVLPLIGIMVYEVVVRYTLRPTLWAYDLSYMTYGAMFMLGAAYTLSKGAHIRADFVYRLWSPRTQGLVDAACYLFLFFPGIGFFLWVGADFAFESATRAERSAGSAWMPYIYPLKSTIPVAAALLLVQGVSEFIKSAYAAIKGRWP